MTSPASPTATHFAPGRSAAEYAARHRALRIWLYAVAFLIFCMVIVGGATRLTDSGLSITEWKPILGAIPPLTEADWKEAFDKYRQIPEYQVINRGMSLEAFKTIYWWEWAHRFLGRIIGLAFLLPFLAFWAMGAIPKGLFAKLVGIFLLGGLQGALGWYMVMSGLSERTDVSQYRLTAHLGLAIVIFGAVLWIAFGLGRKAGIRPAPRALRIGASVLAAAIFLQILLGGFVAGTDAGLSHNSWPLMDGALIPSGLWAMQPWHANLFENVMMVQFNHRMLGYAVALLALGQAVMAWRLGDQRIRISAGLLLAATLGQIALGVLTLLSQLEIGLALAHQGGAVALFALALHHLHLLRRP
jgi:cytochrome c oxidase assembly protein subunit 15